MKTFPVLSAVFFMAVQVSFAQISDDFSDGDLTAFPTWVGDTADFIVNAGGQLQLSAFAAGTSAIATDLPPAKGGTVWEFFIAQSFSPSGANYGRVYLSSDTPDLTAPLNGYYLQFGEAGSTDAAELFRQTGTTVTSVCRGAQASIANAFSIRVKVVRTDPGKWELFIDHTGKGDYLLEATGTDVTYPASGSFGLKCTYTITNATRFFFDDISIQTFELPDATAPEIASLKVLSSHVLELVFSEDIDSSSLDARNFFVDPHYASALHLKDDDRTLIIQFAEPFVNGRESWLRVENIKDKAGNAMASTQRAFLYFVEEPVAYRDIIVTEILADPSPPLALPEAEFIELYNRSAHAVDLSGWILCDASTVAPLGKFILLPGGYLILTSGESANAYSMLGQVLGLAAFPAFNNSADIVVLKDDHGTVIDSLKYDLSWYHDSEKSDGGWTLELIDVNNICDTERNWTASESMIGGTPGTENSVSATRPDNTGPSLVTVVVLDSVTIHAAFDEKLAPELPHPSQFEIQPGRNITAVEFDRSRSGFVIHLADPVDAGVRYTFTATSIYDCPGNKIRDGVVSMSFLLPQTADPGDIILNEILFNPRPAGVDFVELYNASDKTVDLEGWSLRNRTSAEKTYIITADHVLLQPGEYRVITEDANTLKGEYVAAVERSFLETVLPTLNDDEGSIVILDDTGVALDSVFYKDNMHSAFLNNTEGVSLERVSVSSSTSDPSNWRSANSSAGYATPGYVNSNTRSGPLLQDESVVVEPEVIQLQVATRDFARIRYNFSKGGFMANIRIFDQQGRSIREIAANETLGTEGFFRWDGDRDNGAPADRGYYLVWFEIFDVSGVVKSYRKRIAVF